MTTTLHPFEEQPGLEVEGAGSILEAAGGLAVIVLAIVGLGGIYPIFLVSVGGIALGGALLVEGGVIAGEYARLLTMTHEERFEGTELGAGMTTELIAGGATLVLGILALLSVVPLTLLPIAVILTGAALAMTSGAVQRLNDIKTEALGLSGPARRVTRAAVSSAAATQAFVGMGVVVLGIIALSAPDSAETLTLVALLALGASLTLSGTALAGRLARAFKH